LTIKEFSDILGREVSNHFSQRSNGINLKKTYTPYFVFILGNLLQATAQVLNIVLQLYMWVIIIRALLTWVNPDPHNPIIQFLYSITEPVLHRVRQLIPMPGIGIDFSPIIVLLAITFLQSFLVQSLGALALRLQ
jgi:YggT family protein